MLCSTTTVVVRNALILIHAVAPCCVHVPYCGGRHVRNHVAVDSMVGRKTFDYAECLEAKQKRATRLNLCTLKCIKKKNCGVLLSLLNSALPPSPQSHNGTVKNACGFRKSRQRTNKPSCNHRVVFYSIIV